MNITLAKNLLLMLHSPFPPPSVTMLQIKINLYFPIYVLFALLNKKKYYFISAVSKVLAPPPKKKNSCVRACLGPMCFSSCKKVFLEGPACGNEGLLSGFLLLIIAISSSIVVF